MRTDEEAMYGQPIPCHTQLMSSIRNRILNGQNSIKLIVILKLAMSFYQDVSEFSTATVDADGFITSEGNRVVYGHNEKVLGVR